MSKTTVVGFDKVTDGKQTLYIVYLNKEFTVNGTTLFKKSSIVVNNLPDKIFGATVQVDWKTNTLTKVEVK